MFEVCELAGKLLGHVEMKRKELCFGLAILSPNQMGIWTDVSTEHLGMWHLEYGGNIKSWAYRFKGLTNRGHN